MQVLENIVSLHSQYQNGALVQLVRIRACHARGQGFESPTHRQQTGEEISGDKKQETRQFTTASFFVSPHRMAVRTGKGKVDKGMSTSIREGVRLPAQGGGLTPERKSPRAPTLRLRERETIGCSGASIHIPGGRRGSSRQAGRGGAGNSTPAGRHASGGGTAGHGRQTAKKYPGIICRF